MSLATTLAPTTAEHDPFLPESSSYGVNKEKFLSLYELALDEIKYAEDSFGSPYYAGDRVTAREAIDGCADALRQLHPTIEMAMAPRMGDLESKFEALPRLADDL
ncbi:hypothetical protein BX666DRAFT_1879294 [Dichotomocladium elegans]|nr:hypothetical protein BX666DRAFT_1879294 [Dichotomocladium elegans]